MGAEHFAPGGDGKALRAVVYIATGLVVPWALSFYFVEKSRAFVSAGRDEFASQALA